MLKTISGGAFSQKDSIADIYEKTVNAKIELDPVGKEDSDVDNDGDSDSTDKYLLKRRKAIKKAISKQKKENVNKTPEIKLSGKKEDIKISKSVEEESIDEIFGLSAKEKESKAQQKYIEQENEKQKKRVRIQKNYKRYGLSANEERELEEKSVSQVQQKLMGMAYAHKKGKMDDASPEVKKLSKSMTTKQLKDFASTKHEGLPVKKEELDKETVIRQHDARSKDAEQRAKDRAWWRDYKKRQMKKEETEIQEKTDYQLYHKTFSGAMQHAYDVAKKKGYTVDPDDIDNKVATGPKKPSSGKTNRYILGTDKKQNLHVQVANLDNERYELNMYIESADLDKKTVIYEEAFSGKDFDDLKKGDTITVEFKSSISSNNKRTLKVTAKNIVGANKIPKVTLKDVEKPKGIKYFLYKRGNTVSFAQGDMAVSIVNYTINEEVKLDEALPPHLQKHFDKDGDKVEGKWINGKFVTNKVQPKSKFKSIIRDVTPKGYGPTEDVELDEACWPGYKQVGMKKKGEKMVPNCVKEEKFTKGLSKINKLMEKRSMLKGGAGEEGTDDLVKKYKEDTPGQTVTEGNIVYDNNDPFRIFEKLVHYLMGSSVKKISDLTYEMVENANNQVKITDVKGPIGLINEVDVKNFFGQNFTIEDFIDMIEEFGVKMQKQNIAIAYNPAEDAKDSVSEDIQRYYNVIKNDAIIGKQGFLIKKD